MNNRTGSFGKKGLLTLFYTPINSSFNRTVQVIEEISVFKPLRDVVCNSTSSYKIVSVHPDKNDFLDTLQKECFPLDRSLSENPVVQGFKYTPIRYAVPFDKRLRQESHNGEPISQFSPVNRSRFTPPQKTA